ncbi:tetraspanin-17 [Patella vulgata]|uniref:tetraspanin-17 n=1 Tax=Patella vulgata TaxID=6465 RepID=UPI0021806C1C|nr:tetraspanin-17 [Patella vulgata]
MKMARYAARAPIASLEEYHYAELSSEINEEDLKDGETSFSAADRDDGVTNKPNKDRCDDDSDNDGSENKGSDVDDEDYSTSGTRMYLQRHRLASFSLKYALFFMNYLFWIAGIAITAFASWVLYERNKLVSDVSDLFLDPAVLVCVFGIVMVLITFIGCVGSIRENTFLLKLFHYSMTVVLFIEIVLAVVLVFFYQTTSLRKYIQAVPENVLKGAVKRYHDDQHLKDWVDLIQTELKCCGYSHDSEGYKGWQINMYHNCTRTNPSPFKCAVPMSCCILEKGDVINTMCGFSILNSQIIDDVMYKIHTTGCMKAIERWFTDHNTVIAMTIIAVITPQIVSVLFARLLIHYIKKQRARWQLLHG